MALIPEQSSNPVLKDKYLQQVEGIEVMTRSGAVNKSILLGCLMVLAAIFAWNAPSSLFLWGGSIGGFVIVIISTFKPQWSPILAPLYAVLEGLFVGCVSLYYATAFHGIVPQAITLTMGVFFLMLFLYQARIIRVTERFRSVLIMATVGCALFYLVMIALQFFKVPVPFMYDSSLLGIGLSVLFLSIASLNLLLDFDFIEKGSEAGAPKYMEWFAGMGLLITLVWVYLEILKLLSRFKSSD